MSTVESLCWALRSWDDQPIVQQVTILIGSLVESYSEEFQFVQEDDKIESI